LWSSVGGLLDLNESLSKKKVAPVPNTNWQYNFLAEKIDSSEDSPNAGIRLELPK
jgi:hypothetical protein